MSDNDGSAALRLCAACGMCCNGVLFHSVVLQPDDAPRTLSALGLKVKLKQGKRFFLQPCTAHAECRCTIYEDRPARCRKFECLQLVRVRLGSVSEIDALTVIAEVRKQTEIVKKLLRRAGDIREHKPLLTRCETVFIPPLDPSPEASEIREELRAAMNHLEDLLRSEFRVEPTSP